MKKILSILTLGFSALSAAVVVPDDYLINDNENISYVYSEENSNLLPNIKTFQNQIIKGYEEEYGFKLDEKLYVGLASNNNQIANGFSTQIPFNSQIFYGAGAGYIDYFCFSSWMKTLLIHETAHNFQLNPKENEVSRISHKFLGNTPFALLGLFPLFPIPNVTESSFVLEGNAVMNESRYGNGGRLFSGYALAEVISLAEAGKITPALMYNSTLEFPYGEKFYLVGGFFQQFLVKRYGVKRVNGYFKRYSAQLFPFFTNSVFKEVFGKKFETLLEKFVLDLKKEHQGFQKTKGLILASSQVFVPLNIEGNEIFTLVGNGKSSPKVLKIDKITKKVTYASGTWQLGELFKNEGRYYSQSSAKTSTEKISMGLFDKNAYILNGTESKVIQGYMPDGKAVYFDVEKSIETPQVYVNGEFYTQSHSSVHVDIKGNLYYFKQEGEQRILYKNKTKILEYEGHYGFVSDVDDDGSIYFIAASKDGSTAYRYVNGVTERIVVGDDVIDVKRLKGEELLVASISDDGYSYQVVPLNVQSATVATYSVNTILDADVEKFGDSLTSEGLTKIQSKEYGALSQLKYSSLNPMVGYDKDNGLMLNLEANFVDPLMQNSLNAIVFNDDERLLGGLRYQNDANSLTYGLSIYGQERKKNLEDERDYGYDAYLHLPFLSTGYWNGTTTLGYRKPFDSLYREPLTFTVNLENRKQFGFSKYANSLNSLSIFATEDRDSNIYGIEYSWMHDLPWQAYVGLNGKYLKSNTVSFSQEKGVKLSDSFSTIQSDSATLNIPTFSVTTYAKEAKMAEVSLRKVFDGSLYFFSFPLSLQRETVYAKERFYDIDYTDTIHRDFKESIVGVEADLLFLHKMTIPLSLEWLYNENVVDKSQFRLLFGGSF